MIEFLDEVPAQTPYVVGFNPSDQDDVTFVSYENIFSELQQTKSKSLQGLYIRVLASDVDQAIRVAKIYRARYLAFNDQKHVILDTEA